VSERVCNTRSGGLGTILERHENGWVSVRWDKPTCQGRPSISQVPMILFDQRVFVVI
jgi:hypothetical protein